MYVMKFHEALLTTMKVFEINMAQLSRDSGITPANICNYKQGKSDFYSNNLYRLVSALPPEAKLYFWTLCIYDDLEKPKKKRSKVSNSRVK